MFAKRAIFVIVVLATAIPQSHARADAQERNLRGAEEHSKKKNTEKKDYSVEAHENKALKPNKSKAGGGTVGSLAQDETASDENESLLNSKYMKAYEKAVQVGIIDNQPLPSTSHESDPCSEKDPITTIITDTINTVMSNMGDEHRTIVIENEIAGNTFSYTSTNGVLFNPTIDVQNDMHGSFHDNNNAVSKEGDVNRQNGVADFTGALTNNNNAYSESGNVFRQNGVIAVGDSSANKNTDPAADQKDTAANAAASSPEGRNLESRKRWEDIPENAIIVRNKIVDNTLTKTKQNGVIVTPNIEVKNDMSEAFYKNNNAKSQSGDVKRQNGVGDFSNSLKYNNNAFSELGDVLRQNGVIGDNGFQLSAKAAKALFSRLEDFESIEAGLETVFGSLKKIICELDSDESVESDESAPDDAFAWLETAFERLIDIVPELDLDEQGVEDAPEVLRADGTRRRRLGGKHESQKKVPLHPIPHMQMDSASKLMSMGNFLKDVFEKMKSFH